MSATILIQFERNNHRELLLNWHPAFNYRLEFGHTLYNTHGFIVEQRMSRTDNLNIANRAICFDFKTNCNHPLNITFQSSLWVFYVFVYPFLLLLVQFLCLAFLCWHCVCCGYVVFTDIIAGLANSIRPVRRTYCENNCRYGTDTHFHNFHKLLDRFEFDCKNTQILPKTSEYRREY